MVTLLLLVSQVKLPQNYRGNAQTLTNCTVNATDLVIDSQEQAMLNLINNYRQQHGAPLLTFSPNLTRAATWQTIDMSTRNSLSHIDSLNREFAVRITQCGYNGDASAENIARQGPAEDTYLGWVSSPPHNANMLNPQFTAVGIAKVGDYWTVDFGSTNDSGTNPIPSANPIPSSSPEPTFGVIQPCPSCDTPTQPIPSISAPVEEEPEATVIPEPSAEEEEEEETPVPSLSEAPETPNTPSPQGNGGLIALLLTFIKAILEFFLSLLGR